MCMIDCIDNVIWKTGNFLKGEKKKLSLFIGQDTFPLHTELKGLAEMTWRLKAVEKIIN